MTALSKMLIQRRSGSAPASLDQGLAYFRAFQNCRENLTPVFELLRHVRFLIISVVRQGTSSARATVFDFSFSPH
jgi:hypothetical protein